MEDPGFSSPSTTHDSGIMGVITDTMIDNCELQLALKYIFQPDQRGARPYREPPLADEVTTEIAYSAVRPIRHLTYINPASIVRRRHLNFH